MWKADLQGQYVITAPVKEKNDTIVHSLHRTSQKLSPSLQLHLEDSFISVSDNKESKSNALPSVIRQSKTEVEFIFRSLSMDCHNAQQLDEQQTLLSK